MEATVTLQLPCEDVTCEFLDHGQGWVLVSALDEFGKEKQLTAEELHTAQCLVESGVDETGR